ncbi:hypothetical protein PT974_07085 [Cladobotryum mycophilum]|uniref:Uncharacterized protein n=1 Tax=Cladobotryum mycophilum TaxID=491253 RepID=A0ABR0SPI2_9HYPO
MASETTKKDEPPQATFKEQLDQKADLSRTNTGENSSIVDKITEYIPAAAKIIGRSNPDNTKSSASPGPPFRPDHDDKIEDFVRDQHRCNTGEDMLAESKE